VAAVRSVVNQVADAVVCLLLGAVAAVFGAFVHPGVLVVGGIAWPVGLALALGIELLALRLAAGIAGRRGVWLTAAAWVALVLALTWPRVAGDVVVPSTWYGYAFLVLGMAVAMVWVTLAWARTVVRADASPSADGLPSR
jgi:hypothetical protein